jgi:hypothetical protein
MELLDRRPNEEIAKYGNVEFLRMYGDKTGFYPYVAQFVEEANDTTGDMLAFIDA